jgi:hypothetical protein
MEADQNSSRELGLYPKIDLTSLSSNSAKTALLYSKAISPRNRARKRSGNTNRCQQEHVQDR